MALCCGNWLEPPCKAVAAETLSLPAKPGYSGWVGKRGAMRVCVVIAAAIAVLAAGSATAATRKKPPEPEVMRSAAGTVIEPTKTIIHDQYGHTTVIVVPRRSYLETGTEVSPGDRSFRDYMLPPTGDPGRQSWWFVGPDSTGQGGGFMPARPLYIPGFNPNTPF